MGRVKFCPSPSSIICGPIFLKLNMSGGPSDMPNIVKIGLRAWVMQIPFVTSLILLFLVYAVPVMPLDLTWRLKGQNAR